MPIRPARHAVGGPVGGFSGEHLVGHQPERVHVGARVHAHPTELLGAHVPRRPEDLAAQGDVGPRAERPLLGEPEVDHLHVGERLPLVRSDEHVLRARKEGAEGRGQRAVCRQGHGPGAVRWREQPQLRSLLVPMYPERAAQVPEVRRRADRREAARVRRWQRPGLRHHAIQALLCEGWVKNSGSASKMAGMNGGMDFLCGRLVYYDEITNDFGSADSDRIEYLKSITMENCVSNTRTIKVVGEGGAESFTTVVLTSLHYESHLMATNCGPLGLKADVEPGTNRAALSDRYPHRRFHHCCRAGGLAILSRFPVHPRRVLHPDVAWFPAWRVDVDSPIGTLQTLNVHLRPNVTDSGSVVLGLLTTPRVRTTEMETYVEALDADLPAIVAGDFNEEAGGGLRVLEARGLRAVAPAGRASTWRWSTSLGEVDASLDHVVVSPELVADEPRVLRSGRSDHFPVAVELRLR